MDIDKKAKGVAAYAHPDTRDMVESACKTALTTTAQEAREEEREYILAEADDFGLEKGEVVTEKPYQTMQRFIDYIKWEAKNRQALKDKEGGNRK